MNSDRFSGLSEYFFPVTDETLQKRFEEGNEVGDLAMGLPDDYVEVTTLQSDGTPNIPAMLAKTQALVAEMKIKKIVKYRIIMLTIFAGGGGIIIVNKKISLCEKGV